MDLFCFFVFLFFILIFFFVFFYHIWYKSIESLSGLTTTNVSVTVALNGKSAAHQSQSKDSLFRDHRRLDEYQCLPKVTDQSTS